MESNASQSEQPGVVAQADVPAIVAGWDLLRRGRSDEAVTAFEQMTKANAEDVDAFYGQGLALRALGKNQAAIEAFRKALEVSKGLLKEIRDRSGTNETRSSLETTDDDRHMMLDRLIRQRLAELGVKTD